MSQPSRRGGGRPRERGFRDINSDLIGNKENDGRHEVPTKFKDKWLVSGGIASRLWNKSAIGVQINEGTLLTSEEVLFCHWHRHLPLPNNDWLKSTLLDDPELLHRAAVMNTIREPGDVLVLTEISDLNFSKNSWALRWNRGEHPTRNSPVSEIRWVSNSSKIDWYELFEWIESVNQKDRRAEILVVDGEFDVTAYRLNIVIPSGDLKKSSDLSKNDLEKLKEGWNQKITSGEGYWIPIKHKEMPLPQLGVPQASGTWLGEIDQKWLKSQLNSDEIDEITEIFGNLLEKGLWPRPGFKYGCRWRVYSGELSSQHAPWLIVPSCESPTNWNEACLAARLAAGVNKSWLCALRFDSQISFIELCRWSPGKS